MTRHLPLATAIAVILLGTLIHAHYTERFLPRTSESLTDFVERLPQVPMQLGKWEGTNQELDQEEFKLTKCPAAFQRMYRHTDTDDQVAIYLVVGSGRNITMHSPDWCYAAQGYEQVGNVVQYQIPIDNGQSAEFATAFFRHPESREGVGARGVRILWSYSDDGSWHGPTVAKLRYTVRPALCKIYFIAQVTEDRSGVQDTAIPEFAKIVFPVINDVLFRETSPS